MKEYSAGLKPLKATGRCSLNYINEKGQTFAQSFPVRIWFENSEKFCLYGDVMFDPKAVCFAVSGDKYWTYAKQFRVYVTGKTDAEGEDYFSNPTILLDFLEPLGSACDDISIADFDKVYNVLICRDSKSCKQKKIFVDRCDRLIRKIEYYNCSENPVLVVEPGEYKKVTGGGNLLFPHKLIYRHFQGQNSSDWMQIKIDSVKLWQANPEQLKALFSPPDANSFEKSSEHKETK